MDVKCQQKKKKPTEKNKKQKQTDELTIYVIATGFDNSHIN